MSESQGDQVKLWAYALMEKAGWFFYTKPQTYEVTYAVQLNNVSEQEQEGFLGVPLPLENDYQSLLVKPVFDAAGAKIQTDDCYGNRYATMPFHLKAHENQTIAQSFTVQVKPRQNECMGWPLPDRNQSLAEASACKQEHLHPEDERIRGFAQSLSDNVTDLRVLIEKMNKFVVQYLKYGNPINGLYSDLEAIEKKEVDCGGFDALLVSLAESSKIEARIVSGFWAGYQKNEMHAWAELKLPDGTWFSADPSMEQLRAAGRSKKSGRLGFVGSDRIAFSVGCDIPVQAGSEQGTVDILQHPFVLTAELALNVKTEVTVTTKRL